MRRKIVQVPLGDLRAVGTAHLPAVPMNREAVVLLNAGHVPRNGHGGLALRLGDHLSARGWPVLRVDLPGLGDTPGFLPERIESFWLDLKEGAHAEWAAEAARWASLTFAVDRVTLGGVCGAAVTAIFTADRFPSDIDSLLLIEPELFSSEPPSEERPLQRPAPAETEETETLAERVGPGYREKLASLMSSDLSLRGLTSSWRWLRLLSRRRSDIPFWGLLQRMLLRLPATGGMPDRANHALVEAWSRVSKRRVPMLVLTAQGLLWETYFRKLSQPLGRRALAMTHISVPGANHVFSNQVAQRAVLEAVPGWLEDTSDCRGGGSTRELAGP